MNISKDSAVTLSYQVTTPQGKPLDAGNLAYLHGGYENIFPKVEAALEGQAVGFASVEEIDRLNIFRATMLAMERAVAGLRLAPRAIVVDGKHTPRVACPAEAIVKGDTKVPAIMAASIGIVPDPHMGSKKFPFPSQPAS